MEKGALGIRFRVDKISHGDSLGDLDGFVTIDWKSGEGEVKKCRVMCREMRLPSKPFDSLDKAFMEEGDRYRRTQNNTIGYFGIALEVMKANPAISMDEEETRKFNSLCDEARRIRSSLIELDTRRL